jgi:hypothetical protein
MFRCRVVTAVALLLLHCLLVNDWLSVLVFCILLSLLSLWLASSLSLSPLLLEVSANICPSVDPAVFSACVAEDDMRLVVGLQPGDTVVVANQVCRQRL